VAIAAISDQNAVIREQPGTAEVHVAAGLTEPPARASSLSAGAHVDITLEVKPPNAVVKIDGRATHENPLRVPLATRGAHTLEVSARGFITQRRAFSASHSTTIKVELQKIGPLPE
jgi:hypothetical protein